MVWPCLSRLKCDVQSEMTLTRAPLDASISVTEFSSSFAIHT